MTPDQYLMDKYMKTNNPNSYLNLIRYSVVTTLLVAISACESSDEDSSGTGYVKFYNAAKNAPAIHMTLDEDLTTSEDDEVEITYSAIAYGLAMSRSELIAQNYTMELAWQDGDSSERSELAMIHQSSLTIEEDTLHFVVLNEDVTAPNVTVYDIPIIDDDNDDSYDLFNFRILNLHQDHSTIDIYISKADETFNEAVLLGSYGYQQLSDNVKYDQGSFVFYITQAGEKTVLFQSDNIDYYYSAQYLMVVRESAGESNSPFVLDKIANASSTEFTDINAQAQFSLYNAIALNDLLQAYQGNVSLYVDQIDDTPEITSLAFGSLSEKLTLSNGDYGLNLLASEQGEALLSNHLLSLPENADKTVFVYADEINVDDDNDGDVDENGDGIVDQKDVNIFSLVIDNSVRESIYDHEIKIVNLVDNEDFSLINVYFVRSNETIATALNKRAVGFTEFDALYLKNNTYQVYVVAKQNSSDVILTSFELILDENSTDQFLVMEKSDLSPTGYKASLLTQSND